MLEKLKKFSWGYVLIGAIALAVGICFISFQDAYTALAIAMGIILALVGIGFLVSAFVDKSRGVIFGLKIAFGAICIICGIVTAFTQDKAILVIANIIFLLLIIDGAFKLQLAAMSKRYSFFGWWVILSLSVVIIVCSFLLSKFTPENPVTLGVLSGILLSLDGVTNILSAFWSTALVRRIDEGDAVVKGKKVEDKDEAASEDKVEDAHGDTDAELVTVDLPGDEE